MRHKREGGREGRNHQGAANGKAGTTEEARAHGEGPKTNKTNSTQRQGPGHPGPETKESQRQQGRTTQKKKQKNRSTNRRREKQQGTKGRGRRGGGGSNHRGAATGKAGNTKEARARGEPGRGGPTKNKQHTAPRPRAPGAGDQRQPETAGARNRKKKTEHKAAARKTARHKKGGGGQQTPRSSRRPGRNHKRGEIARRAGEREANKTNSTQRQGPGHPGPENKESQRHWGRGTKKKKNKAGGRRKEKQGAKAQGTRGRKPDKERDKGGAENGKQEEEKKKGGGGGNRRITKGAAPARRGPSKAERPSGKGKR